MSFNKRGEKGVKLDMKLSTSELGQQGHEGGEKKCLNFELWHACAGPLVSLPTTRTRVVYFAQGHSEQVAATTEKLMATYQITRAFSQQPPVQELIARDLHDVEWKF